MQINKPTNRGKKAQRPDSSRRVEDPARKARQDYSRNRNPIPKFRTSEQPTPQSKKAYSTEDALIDLYEDPLKKSKDDEQVVINIDFSKPIEFLGKVLRQIAKLARVAQSKLTKENFNKAIAYIKGLSKKQRLIYSGVAAMFVFLYIGGTVIDRSSGGTTVNGGQVQGEQSEGVELSTTPEFELLYPAARTKEDFAVGIAKISPPGAPPTYAYVDTVNGSEIQVSQQQLPDRFKSNQDQEFKEFAESFAANTKVEGDNFLAYVGLNAQGPQSVVMIKDELLVLIKTRKELPEELWSQYLTGFTKK